MIAPKEGLSFRDLLSRPEFYYGAEVVTTRGLPPPAEVSTGLVPFAKALLEDPRIGWISITDNPGGGPMLPPDWLAGQIAERRDQVVLHLTCKDLNRNGIEAAAWRYAAEGFHNILAITGDYPTTGFGGVAGPVFDIDSVGLISLLDSMNRGLRVPGRTGKQEVLAQTKFFTGCVVSPFKRHERELMPQYFKLLRKIRAGAQWVIPQLGYDMRKFHEIKLFLDARGMMRPLIGNVYRLTKGAAKLFNSGKLAGCVVTDELLAQIDKYSAGPDKGRKFLDELAAKQLACFKGLGFSAGYLGGLAKAESFFPIIDLAESYGENDWREFMKEIQFAQPNEFFLFQHDRQTGLSTPDAINPAYLESLRHPVKTPYITLNYRVSRVVHEWLFHRGKGFYNLMTAIYRRFDRKPGFLSGLAYWLEREAKHLGYGCKDCGDCSLPDCQYLCPMASCSKGARNGPCGGSAGGLCELQDKDCIWAQAYERLKYYGETEQLAADAPVVIYNAALKNTSSWANTYLDRDHNAPPQPTSAGEPGGSSPGSPAKKL